MAHIIGFTSLIDCLIAITINKEKLAIIFFPDEFFHESYLIFDLSALYIQFII